MISNIYSLREITSFLTENSIKLTKKRGQNFLLDKNISFNIANTIPNSLERSDHAIEIGGGLGSLTNHLVDIYGEKLTVVEYDKALYNYLKEKYENKINVVHSDILKFPLKNLFDEQNIKTKMDVYGNIPYNITSPILEWLLYESYNKWRFAVFMVQRDFANRLIAKEGENDYSALTVFSNFLSDIKLEFHVSKSVFFPKPNVDSSVISLSPKNVDMSIVDTYKLISKTIFHNRRKTLRNNLLNSPYIKIEAEKIDTIFDTLSIPAKERGENIPISTITDIVRIIENKYDVI